LHEAVVAAGDLPREDVAKRIATNHVWTCNAANAWKEWVAFCYFIHTNKIAGMPCFSETSKLHSGAYGSVEQASFNTLLVAAQARSNMPQADFDKKWKAANRLVDRLYKAGKQDRIFNGKWYKHFAAEDARIIAAGRQYNRSGFLESVLRQLVTLIDVRGGWAQRFRDAIHERCTICGI
jgi:hypothetical protein